MSVTAQTPYNGYTANGVTTVFPYGFLLLDTADLVVTVDGVVKTLTTDYTVSGLSNPSGGNVTFLAAPANGAKVLLSRLLTIQRLTDYQDNGDLYAETVNNDFDRIWLALQQLQQNDIRALKLPYDTATDQAISEAAADRIGKLISFDASGNMTLAVPADLSLQTVSNFIATLLDDANAAAARTTLGLGSAALLTAGTAANNAVQLDANAKLPAVDGSQLTGILAGIFNDFRLTLTSGTPVTTSDVTAAGTIYCCPYKGNKISLYTGGAWVTRSSAQFSLALSALTSGKPYDVFCYDNSGTPTLEFLVWTNDTTRATALAYQDGVLVKSGDATRRYLGTFYTTATTTTEDSVAKRYLWNYYHRVERVMAVVDTTNSWTYSTATWRQANASAANQLECVIGVVEDVVSADAACLAVNSAGGVNIGVGVGVNSTTVNSARIFGGGATNTYSLQSCAFYTGYPVAGRNYFPWLEMGYSSGTTTFYGDNGASFFQTGIQGRVQG